MDKTIDFNYTGHATQGKSYNRDLTLSDIAKLVRAQLKAQYPTCKFSVTTQHYSGGQSMDIKLMSAPFSVFKIESVRSHNPNEYYLQKDTVINEKGFEVLSFIKKTVDSYNFNDSDAQIDYFNVNFYSHIGIGKWDKPFTKTT